MSWMTSKIVNLIATAAFYFLPHFTNMTLINLPLTETKDNGRQFKYDVFVTFSSRDLNWVKKELIPLVEKHKLNYCIQHRDFEIGKPVVDNMAESVYTSRKVLAVMSHNYLSSKFCRGELEMALYRSTEMGDSSVIVMRIDGVDCRKLPKALRNRTFLDYNDFAVRKNWEERLIKHLKPPPTDKSLDKNSTKAYSASEPTEVWNDQDTVPRASNSHTRPISRRC